jgi:hypothetical protein
VAAYATCPSKNSLIAVVRADGTTDSGSVKELLNYHFENYEYGFKTLLFGQVDYSDYYTPLLVAATIKNLPLT